MKRKELGSEFVAIVQRNYYESMKRKRQKFWRKTIIAAIACCSLIPATIYGGSVEFKPDRTEYVITSNIYAAAMVVHEVDHAKDLVCIKNPANGICYNFHGINGWNVGDVCSTIMDNVGTHNPKDDVIVDKWNSNRHMSLYAISERS